VIFALLLPLLQLPPRDRPAAVTPGGGAVSGRIYAEATGAPIEGALVVVAVSPRMSSDWSVWSAGGSLNIETSGYSAETDAAGAFVITGIAPGEYRLVAKPSPYDGRYLTTGFRATRANDPGKPIVVRNGDRLEGFDVALPSAAAIEGRVTAANGEPLSQMFVVAARIRAGSDTPERVPHPPAITDDLGRYRIYGLEPGEYVVATEGRHIALTSTSRERGNPAATRAAGDHLGYPATFHPSAASDAEAQRIRLSAGRNAIGTDIQIARTPLPHVTGIVLDSRGVPAAGASGLLSRDAVFGQGSHSFNTDADGRFRIPALEPATYRLVIGRGAAVNGRIEFAEVSLPVASDIDGLVVSTQPGVAVSGRIVLAEGQTLDTRALRITFERSGGAVRSVETMAVVEADRRFSAKDVFGPHLIRVAGLPAPSTVKAVLFRGEDITDVPTVFRAEDADQLQVVISSRGSTLEGVVRGEGTAPPEEATVYVFGEDRGAWSLSSPRTRSGGTAEGGRFSIAGLAAGRYLAVAIAREGFRAPANPRTAFFDLLSKEATPFVIGEDERRTLELKSFSWPE
jgi:hypothetical protein